MLLLPRLDNLISNGFAVTVSGQLQFLSTPTLRPFNTLALALPLKQLGSTMHGMMCLFVDVGAQSSSFKIMNSDDEHSRYSEFHLELCRLWL